MSTSHSLPAQEPHENDARVIRLPVRVVRRPRTDLPIVVRGVTRLEDYRTRRPRP